MEGNFVIGGWRVLPMRGCIEKAERSVHLKPKAMAVLLELARRPGQVVTRDELFDAVWPGAVVTDDVLTQCVVELRKAWRDSARKPRFVETVPKVGFRLIAPVELAEASSVDAAPPARAKPRTSVAVALTAAMAVLLVGVGFWFNGRQPEPGPEASADSPASVAIFPLLDMSPDGDQEWLADGLTEELINRVSQVEDLQVTGRPSSVGFNGKEDDPREIARELGVDHVLLGSVRRHDDRVRVTARLMNVGTGRNVWSDTYERPMDDIFALQDEIATAVAAALRVRLIIVREPGGTENVEAYEQLLKAQARLSVFTLEAVNETIDLARGAIELDREFGQAWYTLMVAHQIQWKFFGRDEGALGNWRAALDRVAALAPDATELLRPYWVELHLAVGDWGAAESLLQAGAGADTSDGELLSVYADFLAKAGKAARALELLERAQRAAPMAQAVAIGLSHQYSIAGRDEEALAQIERSYARGVFLPLQTGIGLMAALAADDPTAVRAWLDRALEHELGPVHEAMHARLGDRATSLAWLEQHFATTAVDDFTVAVWAGYLGQPELALQAMRRSPDPWFFWHPLAADMRRLPGFRDVLQGTGLIPYWQASGWGDFCRPLPTGEFTCE